MTIALDDGFLSFILDPKADIIPPDTIRRLKLNFLGKRSIKGEKL